MAPFIYLLLIPRLLRKKKDFWEGGGQPFLFPFDIIRKTGLSKRAGSGTSLSLGGRETRAGTCIPSQLPTPRDRARLLEKWGARLSQWKEGSARSQKPQGGSGMQALGTRAMVTPFTNVHIATASQWDLVYHIYTSWGSQRTNGHGGENLSNPL